MNQRLHEALRQTWPSQASELTALPRLPACLKGVDSRWEGAKGGTGKELIREKEGETLHLN